MAELRALDLDDLSAGDDNVMVVAEVENGQLEGSAAELISAAKGLARAGGNPATGARTVVGTNAGVGTGASANASAGAGIISAVLCVAGDGERYASELIEHGAGRVYLAENETFGNYDDRAVARAIFGVIEERRPGIVLAGATRSGRAVMPRVAVLAKTGLSADTTDITVNAEGILEGTKPAFGEHILAVIVCPEKRPQMTTVRPRIYKPLDRDPGAQGELVRIKSPTLPNAGLVKLIASLPKDVSGVNIEDAEVIVGVGRGIGKKENLAMVEELAILLSAEIGVTRPLVDDGYYGHDRQIGQTGKIVRPRLYIACGISGALQHTVGIAHAEAIVAINKDAAAPIFKFANYGIVGDVTKVIPKMIARIKGN